MNSGGHVTGQSLCKPTFENMLLARFVAVGKS